MLNFVKLAQDHRIPYLTSGHHHCHAGWIQTHCPQCTDGSHGWHLGFSVTKGNLNCWRCGPVKWVDFLRGRLRVSVETAKEVMRAYSDGRTTKSRTAAARRRRVVPPDDLGPLLAAHRRYLAERGFPKSVVEDWKLQGTRHLSRKWSWRVVSPICNEAGVIVAYAGRSIKDVRPKVMVTEDDKCGEDPASFLYGIEKVPGDTVIVVEGLTDTWNMGHGSVATLGIDWKVPQANKLRRFKRRFIMFDPEERAQRKAEELANWLSYYPGETEIISGLPSDPGSLSRKRVRRIRRILMGRP